MGISLGRQYAVESENINDYQCLATYDKFAGLTCMVLRMALIDSKPDRALAPARSADELLHAKAMLRPFVRAGYRLFPLAHGTKHARDKGWQHKAYAAPQLIAWLKQGGNLGICLGPTQLVVDVDPRHFEQGDDPIPRLAADMSIDLASVPAVRSGRGDGGRHLYFLKPSGLTVRKDLPGYRGIDVKTSGGLVVAPGSRHIETGGVYEVDVAAAPISEAPMAPSALLSLLTRQEKAPRLLGGGELTVDQLERLLAVLDPRDYRDYPKWIAFGAACHDATAGAGLDVWLDWGARDDAYGEAHAALNARAWDSFVAGRAGGATYMRILRDVARAGFPQLARKIEPNIDLTDVPVRENLTVHSMGAENG